MNQIEMKAYERSLIEPDTTDVVKSDDSLKEILKTHMYLILQIKMI